MSRKRRVHEGQSGEGAASPLLTVDQVAEWLSVSRQSIYKRVARQQLPGARYLGRRLYFHRSTLVHYLHQNRASSQTGELRCA
jgi:excisionase family DNA binding protein